MCSGTFLNSSGAEASEFTPDAKNRRFINMNISWKVCLGAVVALVLLVVYVAYLRDNAARCTCENVPAQKRPKKKAESSTNADSKDVDPGSEFI
jgi:hypothetical protein